MELAERWKELTRVGSWWTLPVGDSFRHNMTMATSLLVCQALVWGQDRPGSGEKSPGATPKNTAQQPIDSRAAGHGKRPSSANTTPWTISPKLCVRRFAQTMCPYSFPLGCPTRVAVQRRTSVVVASVPPHVQPAFDLPLELRESFAVGVGAVLKSGSELRAGVGGVE